MRLASLLLALLLAGPAAAGGVTVEGGRCDGNIRINASDARLSEALKKLSDAIGFTLVFAGSRDPLVNINRTANADTILRELTADSNLLAINRFDPVCNRNVIAEVQILGTGEAVERFTHVPERTPPAPAGTLFDNPAERPRPSAGSARNVPRDIWQKHGREIRNGTAVYDEKTGKVTFLKEKEREKKGE